MCYSGAGSLKAQCGREGASGSRMDTRLAQTTSSILHGLSFYVKN